MKFGKVIYTLYKFRHFFVWKYKIWRNRK
jgi:hypothetical protein